MAALEGFPSPSLTGRLPHGGWAQEMCRDELWIHLYVRTVTVTAPLVSDYTILEQPGGQDQTPRPPERTERVSPIRTGLNSQTGLIWFG